MGNNLVIVESPAKARTIQRFLGEGYVVKPSFGHIRDLQDNKLSVDVGNGFQPQYVIPDDKKKVVSELKKLAQKADSVWLASDEDREGEAISWHLYETLGLEGKDVKRIVFHEITKNAIQEAVLNPRTIDMNLVDAQQARRVLDRLVGFELSPVLWRKIQPKLSAGRVQSVALRLVTDREKEIMAFASEPYYRVDASFAQEGQRSRLPALLDTRFGNLDEARAFLEDCIGARWQVASVEKKEGTRFPAPPFTTSTLQQEAARKLHFPVSLTMRIAQSLYERGLITYMRTDSTNLSTLALGTARNFIQENYGPQYTHQRQFHTHSKGAQEAHEAIRPTFIQNTEIEGTAQEKKLYDLIWKRTVASQMSEAKVMNTTVKISTEARKERFTVQGTQILFDGFLKIYMEGRDDEDASSDSEQVTIPDLHEGDILLEKGIKATCRFTQAPPRYSEATLVKKLEELGIGRPSTYAPTISTLTTGRGYITLNFFNVFWVFVICSVLGLLLEIVWHVVVVDPGVYEDRAGLLYGPFSPIYGFGAVLMTVALNRRYKSNLLVIFLVAGFIGAAFEFFVSWFMETAFGIVAWDYTGTFLSIGGRTNFMFFCMWGALGLVWVRFLLPIMLKWVNKIPWNWRYGATAVATALMLVDGVLTLAAFDCWYQRVNVTMDYEHASAIVAFCNEHYDDEYMEKRFQSMTITPESASRA